MVIAIYLTNKIWDFLHLINNACPGGEGKLSRDLLEGEGVSTLIKDSTNTNTSTIWKASNMGQIGCFAIRQRLLSLLYTVPVSTSMTSASAGDVTFSVLDSPRLLTILLINS
jgi:hypothetical protein